MRLQFKFILQDPDGKQLARITMPFVLNIGAQFENPEFGKGTFEVYRIVKEEPAFPWVMFYCRKLNDTPWLYDHLEKSKFLVMNKSKSVNA